MSLSRHISETFDAELDATAGRLMEMGGLVERQVRDACRAFVAHDAQLAARVREDERQVNRLEVEIDELCVQILARRQPAASDLRSLIATMKASTDLERIGDEADRIAELALDAAGLDMPIDRHAEIRSLSSQAVRMVSAALNALARRDVAAGLAVKRADAAVDQGYDDILRRHLADMQKEPRVVRQSFNAIWTARAIERIGDHAKNICEYVVYLVEGEDVRHRKDAQLSAAEKESPA